MLLPLIISAAIVLGIFVGIWMTRVRISSISQPGSDGDKFLIRPGSGNSPFSLSPRTNKIDAAYQYIVSEYVETVDLTGMNESVLPALLENLDPHSIYIPARDFQRVSEPLMGNFSGIGVSFNMTDDTVAIINTIPTILHTSRIIKLISKQNRITIIINTITNFFYSRIDIKL